MPFSVRPPAVLGIRPTMWLGGLGWLGGIAAVAVVMFTSPSAFGIESPALHTPPDGYQQVGACISGLGLPYRQTNPSSTSPAQFLFYSPTGLTTVLYLLDEQSFKDGQSFTLLNDLGGLPVTFVTMSHSDRSPFPKGNPLNNQLQGPFYQLWVHINRDSSGGRTSC
jgi:hypothetical protein